MEPRPAHPNTSVNWSKYSPITGDPAFYYRNTSPYTESYNLSVERELARNTVLKLGYVGSQAHHLLVLTSANPGNPALCLSKRPGACGPFATKASVRGPFDASFAAITYQKTIGFSNYNSLQASVRHTTKSLELMAAYTYGKSLDDSSSLSEPVYPMGAALSKAISAFDLRHNFVASYRYALPFAQLDRMQNRLDHRLVASPASPAFPPDFRLRSTTTRIARCWAPCQTASTTTASTRLTTHPATWRSTAIPRSNAPAFNTSLFSVPALGTLGNVPRRFFYGPGQNNFDMSLQKELRIQRRQNRSSSASRPSTSSITRSSSAPPPSMETSAAQAAPASDKSSTPCHRARCNWRQSSSFSQS